MATTNTFPIKQSEDVLKKFPEAGGTLGDKAKSITDATVEKVQDTADMVAKTAREAVFSVGQQTDRAAHAVGSGMESMAHTLREKMPPNGVFGAASSSVASGLETGSKYFEKEGLKDIADDVTNLIRRNPFPALMMGVALGFLFGRVTTRS